MKNIKLSIDDCDLLLKFMKDELFLDRLKEARPSGNLSKKSIVVNLDETELRRVFDSLTYTLTDVGIDSQGEINDVGVKLEAIIDQVSNYLY